MFLLKLLRSFFRQKRDVAPKKESYAFQYSNQVIRFFDPIAKEWAEKNMNTLQPRAIEERKQAFRCYDRTTIYDAIVGPDLEIPKPIVFN